MLFRSILELVDLTNTGRLTLLASVVVNVVLSVVFERWGAPAVSQLIGSALKLRKQQRVRDGKTYKADTVGRDCEATDSMEESNPSQVKSA